MFSFVEHQRSRLIYFLFLQLRHRLLYCMLICIPRARTGEVPGYCTEFVRLLSSSCVVVVVQSFLYINICIKYGYCILIMDSCLCGAPARALPPITPTWEGGRNSRGQIPGECFSLLQLWLSEWLGYCRFGLLAGWMEQNDDYVTGENLNNTTMNKDPIRTRRGLCDNEVGICGNKIVSYATSPLLLWLCNEETRYRG